MSTADALQKVQQMAKKGSEFLNKITADGSSGFKAEKGRYHMYVAMACPFTHRALLGRKLKGLEDVIPMSVLYYIQEAEKGFKFDDSGPDCTVDHINGKKYLSEIYQLVQPDYSGRASVPVLWDKVKKTIISNDSAEILRMFNSEFNELCATEEQRKLDLYPKELRQKIDEVNKWVAPNLNLGVYMTGFAQEQEVYNTNVKKVFEHLDKAEELLSKQRYLVGGQLTEADLRLFATLVRFDLVYNVHCKCNKKRIIDYPNLWAYTRDIYQFPGVADTVNFLHITTTYYAGHRHINPSGIIPIGPNLDFLEPHGREKMK